MRSIVLTTLVTIAVLAPVSGADSGSSLPIDLIVTGQVVAETASQPISSVQVHIAGTGIGALTDGDGWYRIEVPDSLAGTEVEVIAEMIGFASQSVTLMLSSAEVVANFTLTETSVSLDGIVVNGADQRRKIGNRVTGADRSSAPQPPKPARTEVEVSRARAADEIFSERARVRDPHRGEGYASIRENRFRSAVDNPLSTFSIDVDRASYANVRRFLFQGHRPPHDAVRIEEMINYFHYDYGKPEGPHPFVVSSEVAVAPWNPQHRLVRIGLQAPKVDLEDLPPNNLVFLIDVSGSMNSYNKLPLLKQALGLLVRELREEDHVSIVVYAGAAGVVLSPVSGAHKDTILEALDRLKAGGSTAGGAGLTLAYDMAAENFLVDGNNRVILATDGDFNVGPSSDAEMIRLIESRRDQGTYLTVLGFGQGNLQDSKMESIADHGNGNFAYIDRLTEARKVLVSEMGGTLLTVAKDVKLQVEFNPAHVQAYRLIGYENRLLSNQDFADDKKDAGEMGAGHTVTALYEVIPTGVDMGDGPLRYQAPTTPVDSDELMFVKIRYKQPDATNSTRFTHVVNNTVSASPSTDFRFASAVAGFGMLLRDSEHAGDLTMTDVLELARSGLGDDAQGYRTEFLEMAGKADHLPVEVANRR